MLEFLHLSHQFEGSTSENEDSHLSHHR
ncbi:unnamed protein product, partial [Rotaria sordida]